jgi:hypothetical protein
MATVPDTHASTPALSYAYKPALHGAIWHFHLASDALEWEAGARGGRVRYAEIRRLRLSFRPASMQTRRFLAEIWPVRGEKLQVASTSWRSMVDLERQDAAYAAFVLELHRRLAAVQVDAAFESGAPALRYWPGVVMFASVVLALSALTVHALAAGQWRAVALIAAVLALFLWQGGTFVVRNRPGRYRPDAPPRRLLP